MRVGGKSRKSRSVKLPRIKLIPLKLCLWPSVTIFSFSDKSREHRELNCFLTYRHRPWRYFPIAFRF